MSEALEVPATTDGRWLRSIRTRGAIIAAWLELIQEGDLSPTAKAVADRAHIGLRTVFQHFSDMNVLHRAAAEEHLSRVVTSEVRVPSELPLRDRIEMLTTTRGESWEATSLLRRACERQEWISADIRELIDEWEQRSACSTLQVFAPELDAMSAESAHTVGLAVDALLSWSTWNHLRVRRSLTVEQTHAVLHAALEALLG